MLLHQLEGEKVGICVSGGLDSKTVATRLIQAGVDVMCFTADLAQPDEEDINGVIEKMRPTGATTIVVDLKDAMAGACFRMIRTQAMYDGGYWNTTGIARAVTVKGLIGAMKENGCTVLAHGATGRGNDQLRFERYTNVLAPDMKVYAPWRDPQLLEQFPGRKQMISFLAEHGIEVQSGPRKRYSTDANLAGLSHEAEDLEDLDTPMTIVEPLMCVWPQQAPDEVESVTLRFEEGNCVAINGESLGRYACMVKANEIGGRNGIGLRNALENRIIGTKSRGVYESPGLELLGFGLRAVYQAVMDRRSTQLFHTMSQNYAQQIYDGRVFDPQARAILAAVGVLAEYATGTVELGLYKGNIYFKALRDCPHTLYNPADASMEASDGLNPVSSQGFVEVLSVEALALAKAKQI
ncbi:Argininosuccinate synthase [Plesiocystis pacifica SIR-1]|uniref:argininosuccinate synthase n=1 Tax=Plesiocystis pacifica SIR-1 TaxID=391625 RepID=A6GEV5_9BACT|nr:argininosuccinate synthase [Plesiocystis pacifica]EDM75617.1 Argininosuccinate synthase [Plesiocystis pacifica SIR-1]